MSVLTAILHIISFSMLSLPSILDGYGIPDQYFYDAFCYILCMAMVNCCIFDPDKWDRDGLPEEDHRKSSSHSPTSFINVFWIVLYSECDPNYAIFIHVYMTTIATIVIGPHPSMLWFHIFTLVIRWLQIVFVLFVGIKNYERFVKRAHNPDYIREKERREKYRKIVDSLFQDQKQ